MQATEHEAGVISRRHVEGLHTADRRNLDSHSVVMHSQSYLKGICAIPTSSEMLLTFKQGQLREVLRFFFFFFSFSLLELIQCSLMKRLLCSHQ